MCNLVCFDIVEGLLTDPNAAANRDVLVHHVSVATIATEVDQATGNKVPGARRRNRMLLESVTKTADPALTESVSIFHYFPVFPNFSQLFPVYVEAINTPLSIYHFPS
jgi:hypothetical protein